MQITVEPRENFTILHLRGEFDTFYCPHLQKGIDSLVAAGVSRIALNLRLVKFINSTALGAIYKASRGLSANGGQLVISRPSNFCRDISDKVGLDRSVPIHDSDDQAYVHLLGDHVAAGREVGLSLVELHERLVDDEWIGVKPKWERHRDWPISFVGVWHAGA